MAPSKTIAPVELSIFVETPPESAFAVFTDQIGSWWPFKRGYSVDKDKVAGAFFEGKVGGRIYERWDDGTEREWGKVLTFDPPRKVTYTWNPGGTLPAETTVEVRFKKQDEGTLVEIAHLDWEKLGGGAEKIRDGYASGWQEVMGEYAKFVQK